MKFCQICVKMKSRVIDLVRSFLPKLDPPSLEQLVVEAMLVAQ